MSAGATSKGQDPQLVNMGPEFLKTEAGKEGCADEVPAAVVQRARYVHPLKHYETIYETKARAMKRWIAIGRDATPPELPPLDDPPRMRAWWVRCMSQRVPEKILALAQTTPLAPALSVSAPPVDSAAGPLFAHAAAAAHAAPLPGVLPPRNGFAGALQRVRESESAAGALYKSLLHQAAAATDPDLQLRLSAEAEQNRRAWEKLVDQLREMERDAVKILPQTASMWLAEEVLASQDVIHIALRDGVRNLLRRVRPKLLGVPVIEQDAIWAAEVEALFAALRANKFTSAPAELAAA